MSCKGKSGVEFIEWIKGKAKFLFNPYTEHMAFCAEVRSTTENYKSKLKMMAKLHESVAEK